MTLRDQVGQLFMIGFEGTELSQDFIVWLQEFRPGGVMLFTRNLMDPIQVADLTNSLQANAPHSPFLIAIDQEGGRVSRLPTGFTIFPPAAHIGACGSSDLAYRAAAITATELRAVGINMNMAPVLDINTNPSNPIIGDRAFGENSDLVCTMGAATLAGLQEHGVIACGKHFPGHGETRTDSHKELPVVTLSRERLEEVELRTFRHAIGCGLDTMMSAHVRFSAFDDKVPATLSPIIMTDLLRGQLGFSGVIISDDLEMHAISDHATMGEAAVQSLQAGIDLLLLCQRQDRQTEAIEAVERALEGGSLSMKQVDASLSRIEDLKKRYLFPYNPVEVSTIPHQVGIPDHRRVVTEILTQSAGH